MRETGAIFGGEVSGHYYFKDFFNADSGTIPAMLVIELLSDEDWHFNVRPSNTEPLLRLNLESLVSPEHMAEKRDEVLALIRG
jgi:phosphomannomutase